MKNTLKALALGMMLGVVSMTDAMAQEIAPININTANAELLAELPGIGAAKAQAIVDEREANGPYESAEALSRVSGIGENTVANLGNQIEY